MKKLTGFLILSLLTLPQSGFCGPSTVIIVSQAAKKKTAEKAPEELTRSILVCARTIVQRKLDGVYGVVFAGELVDMARKAAPYPSMLAQIETRCETALKAEHKGGVTRAEQFAAAKALEQTSCAARALVADFARPEVKRIDAKALYGRLMRQESDACLELALMAAATPDPRSSTQAVASLESDGRGSKAASGGEPAVGAPRSVGQSGQREI